MASITQAHRVALVTGGSQGLGRSIALRLADDGLDVAVNDIASKGKQLQDVVSEIQARGVRAIAIEADVTAEEQVEAMVAKVVEELGGLDVMVANAGIMAATPIVDTPINVWDRVLAVNIRGVVLSYKHAAKQMIKQGRGGRIIGASSNAGKAGPPHSGAYAASKFAVRGLTQSVAKELREHGITVNAYAPGMMMTEILAHPDDHVNGGKLGDTYKKLMGVRPDLRLAEPDSVASLVSYLAKPEAYHITGQTICINGGTFCD